MLPHSLRRFLRTGGALLVGGLLLWIFFRLLLVWLLPFLAGFLLAAWLEGPVRFLTRRLRLPRWAAAGLCTLLLILTLAAGVSLLLWRLWDALETLLQALPSFFSILSAADAASEHWARRLLTASPPELRPMLQSCLSALTAQAAAFPAQLSSAVSDRTAALMLSLPRWGLGLFTATLATYFSSAGRPALLAFLWRQVPEEHQPKFRSGLEHLRATALAWLRAQGLLALLTFFLLLIGLFLLGVEAPLLPALAAAFTDALPVLGAGLILFPWAAFTALAGELTRSLGLLVMWGVVVSARGLLEPKLVGAHIGLSPLAALLAMYVGFCILGVGGMILAPLGLTLVKALQDAGLLHLWRD